MTLVARIKMKRDWLGTSEKGLEAGLAEMATAIHSRAVLLAPVDTAALQNSGKIERTKALEYTVTFGSSKVPYARRRHFENHKNPQTLGYLAKAADSVGRSDKSKYFRGKV